MWRQEKDSHLGAKDRSFRSNFEPRTSTLTAIGTCFVDRPKCLGKKRRKDMTAPRYRGRRQGGGREGRGREREGLL